MPVCQLPRCNKVISQTFVKSLTDPTYAKTLATCHMIRVRVTVNMAEMIEEGSGTSSPVRRQNEGSGTPSLVDFSSFCEMLREERESARAER